MFEKETEESILKRMLEKVPKDIDKREGSIIYDALAPAALEMARMYSDMDSFLGYTFASPNMPEEFLDLRVGEEGLKRNKATYAIKKGLFYDEDNNLMDISLGSRFSIDKFNFKAIEKISQGVYKMESETVGINSNSITGTLIPIDYIEGLASAKLGELIIPGQEKESNEMLYARYIEHLNENPYGGNISDYRMKTKDIQGVGAVKIFPIWNGGGTVKVVFLDSNFNVPNEELVNKVQTTLDPVKNQGKGMGLAPVGHVVTVKGSDIEEVTIKATLSLRKGLTVGQVQGEVEDVINKYFLKLRNNWESSDNTIVRISQIESKILEIEGIVDIFNTTINGKEQNLTLGEEVVPLFKAVFLNA